MIRQSRGGIDMGALKGKVIFITGGSRGIGHAIGMKAASTGASIVIAAKTVDEHPRLPGTIHSARRDMEKAGGRALAVQCDIRFQDQVKSAIDQAVEHFGGIDILINNASAISLTATEATDMKRYDLMHQVNGRGTFLCSKLALPYLKEAENPHILNISPPLNMNPRWFAPCVAYTTAKYEMSMCTLGMAEELKRYGIAVNSLWPETAIATAAVMNLLGGESMIKGSRKPEIMADAAIAVLSSDAREVSGNFFIDVDVLKKEGVSDFERYAVEPGHPLVRDFFIDNWITVLDGAPSGSPG